MGDIGRQKSHTYFRKALLKGLLLLGLAFLILGWAVKQRYFPEKVHYHAGFIVVQENKILSFSDPKFMNFAPCTVNGKEIEGVHEDEQIKKAHLHDNIGDVIHVETNDNKWSDLFKNINWPLPNTKILAYINGKEINNFQYNKIEPFDSLIIFIGNNDVSKFLSKGVTKAHIEDSAKKSESCGS